MKTGYLSDLWVYNVSGSGWRYIVGSKVPNQVIAGTLEPRAELGHWRDPYDNSLVAFGGYNIIGGTKYHCKCSYFYYFLKQVLTESLFVFLDQSVWKLNLSIPSPKWTFVAGTNSSNSVVSNQPIPRAAPSCGASPTAGGYCFGGSSYQNGK